MNYLKVPLVVLLGLCVSGLLAIVPAGAQGQSTALERGYRTGYSDGYTAGYKDVADHAARDYQNKEDYQKANRSYNDVWGPIEDYRDGYQQGFEAGYAAGFEQQQFNSSLPAGLHKRGNTGAGNVTADANVPPSQPTNAPTTPATNDNPNSADPAVASTGSLSIPKNTILALELLTPVSTDVSQRGDRIEARVVEPAQYANYTVEGRISQLKRPGKVKGVAEKSLRWVATMTRRSIRKAV
jgi:hypothetical protein